MQAKDLLVSSLHITEDEYDYKGIFILSANDKSMNIDISTIDSDSKINEIKQYFGVKESINEIRKTIMDMVIDKANISSRHNEGKNFDENKMSRKIQRAADSMDLA